MPRKPKLFILSFPRIVFTAVTLSCLNDQSLPLLPLCLKLLFGPCVFLFITYKS
jgi:hypothetical protein